MTFCLSNKYPSILVSCGKKNWQEFIDAHAEKINALNEHSRSYFQQAITLSDFVFRSAMQSPELVIELFSQAYQQPKVSFELHDYSPLLALQLVDCQSEEQLHTKLREFRLVSMVQLAVEDMIFDAPLETSLANLSNLADALILGALKWLTDLCQQKWGIPSNSEGKSQPLLVYGMGKLGGKELNFSSDIDLIFVYPEQGETTGARKVLDNHQFFTRLAQKLITALNQQTADGFVYRVDMRLRPFGESGPLVLSFSAMEDYYQEQGRDWERYAMLKARLIGQGEYHQRLSTMLRPFVYRRYIDFSVIESLRKMKMMIAQEVRRKQLKNNIKLGAGGIREVEFIVQVFQLIRGGRVPQLQQRSLITVLPLLVQHEEISDESANVLTTAYRFLRRVENIIQALDDKQTQTLPDDELNQTRLLTVLNFNTWADFLAQLNHHLAGVHKEFLALIGEEAPNQESVEEHWQTLWHSFSVIEQDNDWHKQLAPNWTSESVWQAIAQFKQDCDKRSVGARGRQVLDKLMPRVFWRLYEQGVESYVPARVLKVLSKIVSRTAYLELLFENEGALLHLIKLCDMSAWISDYIALYPILLDELIDPQLLNDPPALSQYSADLQQYMLRIPEDDVEMQMDALRQFKQTQQLRIAAADISSVLPIRQVSDHLTALAESIIAEVVQQAWQQITRRFGQPLSTVGQSHKGFAVIGYGKMGGIELGYGSDLDLVFIHQSEANELTNGDREIPATQFYVKLAQKIMHICNTRMGSGMLYELDMRLRPSGNSGVLVVHLDSFSEYQTKEAWTWEHQALVRSRVVYGHPALVDGFNQVREQILSLPREIKALKQDVIEMRNKMRNHIDSSSTEYSDIKQAVGGLVDIEFLMQYLVLAHTAEHHELGRYSDNFSVFEQLAKLEILTAEQSHALIDSYCMLRNAGHKAVLQSVDTRLLIEQFDQLSKPVKSIWQQVFSEKTN